jgi:hypothetical protein
MAVKGQVDIEVRDQLPRQEAMPAMTGRVEDLLAHFFAGAVGLRLLAPIVDIAAIRLRLATRSVVAASEPPTWVAWATDVGSLCACAVYDHAQAQRLQVHVLLIEWWLPLDVHHAGWWRCDPKRPREWTVGRGGWAVEMCARRATS